MRLRLPKFDIEIRRHRPRHAARPNRDLRPGIRTSKRRQEAAQAKRARRASIRAHNMAQHSRPLTFETRAAERRTRLWRFKNGELRIRRKAA